MPMMSVIVSVVMPAMHTMVAVPPMMTMVSTAALLRNGGG
jgi:hypothetical protein